MNWKLLVTKSVKKELANLPRHDQIRIEHAIIVFSMISTLNGA